MMGHHTGSLLCTLLSVITCCGSTAQAQTTKTAPVTAPQVMAPKAPTVTAPAVTVPAGATTSGHAPVAPNGSSQRAPMIAPLFDETAFKTATATGNPVLLIFSGVADSIWTQQAPLLQGILREPEFARIPVFQIDATNVELMGRFAVSVPGTLILMKDGVERLRSTRMTKADVIRKMLRLQTAL